MIFLKEVLSVPVVSQVRSKQFNLTVLPDQLQFSPAKEIDAPADVVRTKLGLIVDKLPETPYTAIGANFTWHLLSTNEDIPIFCKQLFFRSPSSLYKTFDTDDALFGAYLSKNVLGSRLRLDIKPITINRDGKNTQALQFAFNFHVDLIPENKNVLIHELLDKWETAGNLAESIVTGVIEEYKPL